MSFSVFTPGPTDYLKQPFFFGNNVSTARYDVQKHPQIEKLTEKQLSFFWRPEEIDLNKDSIDFKSLPVHEQHIFIENLKYQTLLDSIQGRSPNIAFLPIVSLPELESWIECWSCFEGIHSRSYTHIIRNVFTDPSIIFDDITVSPEILKRAERFARYYDDLIEKTARHQHVGDVSLTEVKRALLRALVSVNALEAIAFYVSFACSFAFAERNKMEGNAKIIKLIARDEALHLSGTEYMINCIRAGLDDPELKTLWDAMYDELRDIYIAASDQEKQWADHLFKDGSMIGLNKPILCQFVEYMTNIRMEAVGFTRPYPETKANPLPWFSGWVTDAALETIADAVQVAPQEAEISSYRVGAIDTTMDDNAFGDFDL
jgi:ribonucleoside-diphosphate reductase beta chain